MIWQIFFAVIALFVLLLIIKARLGIKVCVICLSVSLTWLSLLLLYHLDRFSNQLVIGLLMGQSVTGIYYVIEKRLVPAALVFRLPILLTLTYVFYVGLTLSLEPLAGLVVGGSWLVMLVVYLYRTNAKVSGSFKKIVECCGNW